MQLEAGLTYVGIYETSASGMVFRFPDLPGFLPCRDDDYHTILAALAAHLAGVEATGMPVPRATDIRELMKDPANRRPNRWFKLDDLATHVRLRQDLQRLKAEVSRSTRRQRGGRRSHSGRRLAVVRPRQKIRGWKRRVNALRSWAASYQGFFPEPSRNGYGQLNWYAKLPVYEGFVCGPQARRWFQRECMLALVEIGRQLRAQKPPSDQRIRIVAVISPADVFSASIDVFWGDESFFGFFAREGPDEAWTRLDAPDRSLMREWRLGASEAERGFCTRYWDETWEKPHCGELWAIGDVEGL